MEFATVVVVPGLKDLAAAGCAPQLTLGSKSSRPVYSSMTPILGNDVLGVWMDRVRKLGVESFWLTSSPHGADEVYPAMAGFAGQGIDRLLLIRLKSYAEMDLNDVLRFHNEAQNSVTPVHDHHGQLGVCVFDRAALAAGRETESSGNVADHRGRPYPFRGYAKRILAARERQELIQDALTGACRMRPLGEGIREDVWVGDGVRLADSARIVGPSYIGDRTIVRAGATIGPFASVERDCIVDCGTTIERATVLPHTYLAPGLLIRNALVDGGQLEDLSQGTVVDLRPGGLAARLQPRASCSIDRANAFSREFSSARQSAPSPGAWRQVRL